MKRTAQQKRDLWFIGYGVLAMAIVLALAVWGAAWYAAQPPGIDSATLCPAGGARGHVVLLMDRTDPLTPIQKGAFTRLVESLLRDGVKEGERLSLFAVEQDVAANSAPLFESCRPDDGSTASPWTANPERRRRLFQERFAGPLLDLIAKLTGDKPAERHSPIMEMLQVAAVHGFRKQATTGPRRLIVVSDMLHNTPAFSLYRGASEYARFSESAYAQRVRADLEGVRVELFYLMHTPELQTRRNVQFWEDYFRAMGASVFRVTPLEG